MAIQSWIIVGLFLLLSACLHDQPPVADAGPDQYVSVFQSVYLEGDASYDPDGDVRYFSWEITVKPDGSNVNLDDPFSKGPMFVPDLPGVYIVELTVYDAEKQYSRDFVKITVTSNGSYDSTKPPYDFGSSPNFFDHTGISEYCEECHNGVNATGKPASHIATSDKCAYCHSVFTWVPANRIEHDQVLGACVDCHNGVVASGKPYNHIASTDKCDACHQIVSWIPVINVSHNDVLGSCDTCHIPPPNHVAVGVTTLCDACHSMMTWSNPFADLPTVIIPPGSDLSNPAYNYQLTLETGEVIELKIPDTLITTMGGLETLKGQNIAVNGNWELAPTTLSRVFGVSSFVNATSTLIQISGEFYANHGDPAPETGVTQPIWYYWIVTSNYEVITLLFEEGQPDNSVGIFNLQGAKVSVNGDWVPTPPGATKMFRVSSIERQLGPVIKGIFSYTPADPLMDVDPQLAIQITSKYPSYQSGDLVLISASLFNDSKDVLRYFKSSPRASGIVISVDGPGVSDLRLYNPNDAAADIAVVAQGLLVPGQTLVREVVWDQMLSPQGSIAPPGVYTATAYLIEVDELLNEQHRIVAKTRFEITTDQPTIREEDAILKSLEDPTVNDWYQRVGSSMLCIVDNQTAIVENGSVTPIATFAPVPPEQIKCRAELLKLESLIWQVRYASKALDAPIDVVVSVDAVTGQLIN